MIWSPMTAGEGEARYSIYCPIYFHDVHRLDGFAKDGVPVEFGLLHKVAVLEFEAPTRYAFLRVRSWTTEVEARAAYEMLCSRMALIISTERVACSVGGTPQEIDRTQAEFRNNLWEHAYRGWSKRDPPTDGIIDPYAPCVLPEHERIICHAASFGREVRIVTPEFLSMIVDSSDARFPATSSTSETIRLALSIVSQANAQRSPILELMNLIRALETIAEQRPDGPKILALVEKWSQECAEQIKAERANEPKDDESILRFEYLRKRVGNLKTESFTSAIIRTASEATPLELPEPRFKRPDKISSAVQGIYKARSDYVHSKDSGSGQTEDKLALVNEHLPVARHLAACVLNSELEKAALADSNPGSRPTKRLKP